MSGKIELNISESTLERLRCSVCEGYLSCPPIRILQDGSNICGRCSPPEKDAVTCVQFTLEAIMRDATFPCTFSQNGCTKRLVFGYTSTIDHEAECAYRNGACPEFPKASCSNEAKEESNKPSTFLVRNAELTVKVDKNDERVSVTNDSTVINPYNARRSSRTPSVISLRNWNGNFNPPPRPPTRTGSWSGNNSFGRNNNNYSHRTWQPFNTGYRRQPYHKKRKNNLVIIKGHTLYITL